MGPLAGVRILEIAALGPGPFGGMLLADMGAEVVRVERPQFKQPGEFERRRAAVDPRKRVVTRDRRSLVLDLKRPEGKETLLRLVKEADALTEGFRPGVMERLGLGPEECLAANPKLVYARITGWGQEGPMSQSAGHDINYIALAGALENFRRQGEVPTPPLSVLGDMGGGGMFLAFGVLCGIIEARTSGKGQVVDAAMTDGVAAMLSMHYGFVAQGRWKGEPGTNFADTGAPYYEVYETSDGRFVSVGCIETPFWNAMIDGLDVDAEEFSGRDDPAQWGELKEKLRKIFITRTRDEWAEHFAGTDACVTPVLTMCEAPSHPHLAARQVYIEAEGVVQNAPAPRFSRTTPDPPKLAPRVGEHTEATLGDWGFSAAEIAKLKDDQVVVQT